MVEPPSIGVSFIICPRRIHCGHRSCGRDRSLVGETHDPGLAGHRICFLNVRHLGHETRILAPVGGSACRRAGCSVQSILASGAARMRSRMICGAVKGLPLWTVLPLVRAACRLPRTSAAIVVQSPAGRTSQSRRNTRFNRRPSAPLKVTAGNGLTGRVLHPVRRSPSPVRERVARASETG